MGKRMRYGPRFSGGSVGLTRGPALGLDTQSGFKVRRGTTRPPQQVIASVQNTRQTFLKKKGIKPSLARTSLEVDRPQSRNDKLMAIAARAVPNSHADSLLMEQNGCALVIVVAKGKPHTVCVDIARERVEWVEGP